jgi:hypothetical protein
MARYGPPLLFGVAAIDPKTIDLARQVSPIACQLDPGLALMGPPPMIAFPFISQIEVWPLVF